MFMVNVIFSLISLHFVRQTKWLLLSVNICRRGHAEIFLALSLDTSCSSVLYILIRINIVHWTVYMDRILHIFFTHPKTHNLIASLEEELLKTDLLYHLGIQAHILITSNVDEKVTERIQ